MYMYSQMFNANDSAVHEKWAKFQTKTQKNSEVDSIWEIWFLVSIQETRRFLPLFWETPG